MTLCAVEHPLLILDRLVQRDRLVLLDWLDLGDRRELLEIVVIVGRQV